MALIAQRKTQEGEEKIGARGKVPWKKILLGLWGSAAAGALALLVSSGVPLADIPALLRGFIQDQGAAGPLVYILLYTVRPIVLFPASVLTAASGLIWGPFGGIAYTLVGENLSAAFAFGLARYVGREWAAGTRMALFQGVERQLKERGFMTVLIMRLIYLPFDATNFACGLTGMSFREYSAGTFLGIIPGAVTFVYFGSGWFDRRNLAISAVIFAVSLVIARIAKRSRAGRAACYLAKIAISNENPDLDPV